LGRWRAAGAVRILGAGGTAGAGEWQSPENGSRWRMAVAGEWQALENGRRWRILGAGEGKGLQPPTLLGGTEKGGTLSRVGSRGS
jgi:hypothetical protein